MAQIVQQTVVLHQILADTASGRDLVGQAPAHDGRVVIVLHDQLGHLAESVLPALGHVLGDVGDLGPDDHAVFVAQIVEIPAVLVVGQAHGVGAHLPQKGHVLVVLPIGQGAAQALAVLVAGRAAQAIGPAVEQEPTFRVKADGAARPWRCTGTGRPRRPTGARFPGRTRSARARPAPWRPMSDCRS